MNTILEMIWDLLLVGVPVILLILILINKIRSKAISIILIFWSSCMIHLHAIAFIMERKPKDSRMSEIELWIQYLREFNLEAWMCIFMYLLVLITLFKVIIYSFTKLKNPTH